MNNNDKAFLDRIREVRQALANASDEEVIRWLVKAKILKDRKADGTWTSSL